MNCSKTKLGLEFHKIIQLPIENAYPADVLISCINQQMARLDSALDLSPNQ